MSQDRTILVIDDDADARQAIVTLLESEGYATFEAANGREALALLEDGVRKPDLIVLDMIMPVMDGLQFRRAQLVTDRLEAIPVILLTAAGRRVPDDGGLLIMSKPPDIPQFLAVIAGLTRGP